MDNATDAVANWLDRTDEYEDERRGLAGDLAACCIQLFVALLQDEGLKDEFQGLLRIQAQRFSL